MFFCFVCLFVVLGGVGVGGVGVGGWRETGRERGKRGVARLCVRACVDVGEGGGVAGGG